MKTLPISRLPGIALNLILILFAARAGLAIAPAGAMQYAEPPFFAKKVAAGELPPVAMRVPAEPRIMDMKKLGREPGEYGGRLRMLMGKHKDIRMMTVYGYARLIGYNEKFELVADILKSFDVQEGRIFTFHLRKGHKWSDGKPFTSEDFRYGWNDVIADEDIGRRGYNRALLVDGKPPQFEVIDETTVRYTWQKPNPNFLPALAAPRPLYLYKPAHYLRQFHKKYQKPDTLAALIKEAKVRDWVALHFGRARQYRPDNPEQPVLTPWRNTVRPPADQFVFVRNPYYHRVDASGKQLPYIDKVVMRMGSKSLIPLKTSSGEADLQARYLYFDNYTVLKQSEKRNNLKVHLWRAGGGSVMTLLPNLNVKDMVWRKVFRDVRFRRALSVAIERHEINQILYFGLARESGNSVIPESPLYKNAYQVAWSRYQPALARKLLDDMGLTTRDGDGYRLLPDGRRLEIVVETAGESTLQTDILELIVDYYKAVGIKLFARPSQRENLRRRVFSGQTLMSVWFGLDNGVPSAETNPSELVPSSQSQLQWPRWGLYRETSGQKGDKPDMPKVLELISLSEKWNVSKEHQERVKIWHAMLKIFCDQVYTIGIVNGTLQPIVVSADLHNVPEKAVYSWAPGAYFGVYMMDSFWFNPGTGVAK